MRGSNGGGFMRAALTVIVLVLTLGAAQAESCARLIAQARFAGSASAGETAALTRQLAAIRGLERKRGCASGRRSGGFFDPCGELASRRADVQRQIARSGGSAGLKAKLAALGCGAAAPRRKTVERQASVSTRSWDGPRVGANAMLFCVRRDDGYYFPVPASQFVSGADYALTVDQCRYICNGADVAVYELPDPAMESEQMVSVETGQPYSALPKAFAYRDDANFEGCNFHRYVRRVEEARARTVTPKDMSNALIPLPSFRPDSVAVTAQAYVAVEPTERGPVRIVGPNFFPE